jgi:hypothetical protein
MLTTTRRDQRTRRQALFILESLDDRLVLSAAAGAAAEAVAARHEAKLERVEARHEARLARVEARHEAGLAARVAAHPMSSDPVAATTPHPGGTVNPSIAIRSTVPTSPVTQPSSGSLPSNVAAALQSLYTEYEGAGSDFKPTQPTDMLLQISGDNVEVSIKVGSSTAFNTALSQLQADGMQVSSSSSTYGLVDGMLPISELPAAAQLASSVNPAPPPIMR